MVKSKIEPENINYNESKEIDDEDIDYSAPLYDYKLYDYNIEIGLGKQKYTYSKYGVVYFPIYLIIDDDIDSKIGVYEVNEKDIIHMLDDEEDIKLKKKGIIFFVSKDYIKNKLFEENALQTDLEKQKEGENKEEDRELKENNEENKEFEEDDVANLSIPSEKLSKTKEVSDETLKDGIFTENKTVTIPPLLEEESKEQSDELKKRYQQSSRNNWLENFRKNNNYKIIDNEGGGDCFFAVLRDAFHQIGKDTTVEKLRALLSKEASEEVFTNSRIYYTSALAEVQENDKEMKQIKKTIDQIKRRIEKVKEKQDQLELLNNTKELLARHNRLKTEKKLSNDMVQEFSYMEGVDTIEKFRELIMTSKYWADTWAISTLEKLLNIKVIVLSKQSYDSGDLDSTMVCGQLNDKELEEKGEFQPDFYIMTSYTGNHYTLISYKEKHIFKFIEIPYDIKIMIITKCLEKNAGPYYLIKDFKNLKRKLGLDENEGKKEENDDDYLNSDLYNDDSIFMFYNKSNTHPKAGKGNGEKTNDLMKFNNLNSIKDWRRKLDDEWQIPITIDTNRWNSVQHYFLGSQFKKGFPDYYLNFSIDSNSEISNDVKKATDEYNKVIKTKKSALQEGTIIPDPDFFMIRENPTNEIERLKALTSKFTQNLELKRMLIETKDSKLLHFHRGKDPEPDILLMKLRNSLRGVQ
jgi:hypothetical protein